MSRMFGSHLSIAGGLHNALTEAQTLGMDCVQIFTKNQRQWNAPPLKDAQIATWLEHRKTTGIEHVVSHDSYLINLASPDDGTHGKSMKLFAEELRRCDALKIPHLVTHPGAHVGQGEEVGLQRVADSMNKLHDELPDLKVVTCLEVTAGQGTTLGYQLEHLAWLRDHIDAKERVAVCLDTAHLIGAGYDLTSEAGAKATIKQVKDIVGMEQVRVVHMNDSKVARGSRKDRHEHIGHGYVSLDAFRVFCKAFRDVPKILETAKEHNDAGEPWDAVNLATLRSL